MSKIAVFGLVLAATFATTGMSQARQISVWGNNFDVGDGPAVAAPPPPRFNALVSQPRRHDRNDEQLLDLDHVR